MFNVFAFEQQTKKKVDQERNNPNKVMCKTPQQKSKCLGF
jgi:hypothetical protein